MLTDLKGKEDEEVHIPNDDSLLLAYFLEMRDENSKRRSIKRSELRDAFFNCRRRRDKLKLDVAYLVECLVCGSINKKLVDLDTLQLVTDMNAFNQVAWGLKGFNCLAQHKTNFKQLILTKHVYQLGKLYNVLQVFTLEVFSQLVAFCGSYEGSLWPRMANWKMTRSLTRQAT